MRFGDRRKCRYGGNIGLHQRARLRVKANAGAVTSWSAKAQIALTVWGLSAAVFLSISATTEAISQAGLSNGLRQARMVSGSIVGRSL